MKSKEIIIFFPSIESGGADKNLFLISNFLSKNYNVTIVTSSIKFKYKFKQINYVSPNSNFFEKFGRDTKTFISLIYLIKTIFAKKKALIFSLQSNLIAILIAKLFFLKIITRSNSFPNNWTNNPIKKFIFKKIYKLSNQIIVNSLQTKNDFKKFYNLNSTCIYNPLNISDIKILAQKKIPKIYSKNKLRIINVGRLSIEKDHIIFLKALKLIKNKINFEAIILGKGNLKSKIIDYIKHNDLKKFVKLINYKKNPYPYINQSNFLILTSIHEGLPNVLLEAQLLKKFIISSNCLSGPKEILLNGKGGALFKIKDYKQLAKLIIFYAKNPKICKSKINYSYKFIKRFDLNHNLNLYSNIIKKFF